MGGSIIRSLHPLFHKRALKGSSHVSHQHKPEYPRDGAPKSHKPNSARDYRLLSRPFFLTVGVCCRRSNKRAAAAAFTTSGFILAQSLVTDYRFGAKPVFSFETRGKMDSVLAASSWLIPRIFGFNETPAAKIFESNSLAEASVWDDGLERRASTPRANCGVGWRLLRRKAPNPVLLM